MKTSQYFPLIVSSLVVGGVMLVSNPAQSAIFLVETSQFPFPLVGFRYVFAGSAGSSPLNIISFTSPEFPITQINNNNTPLVNASIVGGVLLPGSPFSYELNIEDNPDGTAVLKIVENVLIVITANGIEELALPTFTISSSASAEAKTSFSAFKTIATTEINGVVLEGSFIYQIPGDQLSFTDTSFTLPVTNNISSQAIPGYVPFDQLNNFGTSEEFILQPGENLTFTNPQPLQSTPESSTVLGIIAVGVGGFWGGKKRKSE